jgi:DNA-binding PadR family transcriptional regulator
MLDDSTYIEQVVTAWEDGYKKGLLTFWVLMALQDGEKHVQQIKHYIEETMQTNLTVDEKSLYRSIGRFKKMDLISSQDQPSDNGGPAYKAYVLTATGRQALKLFCDRNILNVFLTPSFKQAIERIKQ